MDRETRNRIQRATQDARNLLEREYAEQLAGTFDIFLDGTIATTPGGHLDAGQRLVRSKLVTAIEHLRAAGHGKDAVVAYVREASFTTLNRFVALKMLEARGLVQECLSRGEESSGFKEFVGLAPGLVQLPDHGYRLYIESLFDEIGREVRVLFDRRDPASLLWPRRQPLLDLLAIINAADLASVWGEDETIGWVYQYFNSDEDRRRARYDVQGNPKAPQDSYELAVRNQFFTPSYVVQFLTDNTLGRIWYEMRRGGTALRELDYLVLRPNEVFLCQGEAPPAPANGDDESLSQEELLRHPAYCPFRAKKDPRDIRVLDPACGSGHFLLYTFDLLLVIYEEAWADEAAPPSEISGKTLREDYANLATLRAAVPELILRHNLYGIDIDARCAQIAALALWMRAQRAYKDLGISRDFRPPIQRTNIVIAEPMPGEPELRHEFIASLDASPGRLVERVFEQMELAGEAGSLLPIEDEIRDAVLQVYREHGELFRASDEERWTRAEDDLLRALHAYAEHAANGRTYQRRLFAHDAARGLGFIHASALAYDVVLMNPPFGEPCGSTRTLLDKRYAAGRNDIYAAFALRGLQFASRSGGRVGIISSRAFVAGRDMRHFRASILSDIASSLSLFLDLGPGVLDAMVETAAYTLGPNPSQGALYLDARTRNDKASAAREHDTWCVYGHAKFRNLPMQQILYDLAAAEVKDLVSESTGSLEPDVGRVTKGLSTGDDTRFVRAVWEVRPQDVGRRWHLFAKGGEYSWFTSTVHLVVNRADDGKELAALAERGDGNVARTRQSSTFYGLPAATWSRRSQKGFSGRRLRAGICFSDKSPVVVPGRGKQQYLESLPVVLASSRYMRLIVAQAKFGSYETGSIKPLPVPTAGAVAQAPRWRRAYSLIDSIEEHDETSLLFRIPAAPGWDPRSVAEMAVAEVEAGLAACGLDLDEEVRANAVTSIIGSAARYTPIALWLAWSVGASFGRFDVRLATEEGGPRPRPEPFGPLLPCSPGTFTGAGGLPVEGPPPSYPVDFPRDGILVDDLGHERDITARSRHVFQVVFGEAADARWHEAAETLPPRRLELRSWFAHSFFELHLGQYSKSRRRAPIYWQLATPTANYSVWLYYHRFTRDMLYRALSDYVTPKLKHEERKLTTLTQDAGPNPSASQRREINAQEKFVAELRVLREEIGCVAPLWNPDLDDGVIINFAPLWRLVPQNRGWQEECKGVWDQLVSGDYDWARLAMHLWPERVIPKCATDRSLAIAHGLEEMFWEEDAEDKWRPKRVAKEVVDRLIEERTSSAVKAALDDLLRTPARTAPSGGRRRSGGRRAEAKGGMGAASRSRGKASAAESSVDEATVASVRDAIAAAKGGASKAEVMEATGISRSDCNAAINALLAQGTVIKSGAARGMRYQLAAKEQTA